MTQILVGTSGGLHELDFEGSDEVGPPAFHGREVTALAADGEPWAIVDGRSLVRRVPRSSWTRVGVTESSSATCLLSSRSGVFVGTSEAHLLLLEGDELSRVEGFDRVRSREEWFTPWGGSPEVRSLAEGPGGTLHVNVHVGGIVRSLDGGATWEPTIAIHADVHQVLTHPEREDLVLAPCARGLALSDDGGKTWRHQTHGLHATYCEAASLAGDVVLMCASDGPFSRHAVMYRAELAGDELRFNESTNGLPQSFGANIDTGCLSAAGSDVAVGTERGELYVSADAGAAWRLRAHGLPTITTVLLV